MRCSIVFGIWCGWLFSTASNFPYSNMLKTGQWLGHVQIALRFLALWKLNWLTFKRMFNSSTNHLYVVSNPIPLDFLEQHSRLSRYCGMPSDRNLQLPQTNTIYSTRAPTPFVECVGGCGEKYCSEECKNQACIFFVVNVTTSFTLTFVDAEHHQLLCVGPITDAMHPLVLFKQYLSMVMR